MSEGFFDIGQQGELGLMELWTTRGVGTTGAMDNQENSPHIDAMLLTTLAIIFSEGNVKAWPWKFSMSHYCWELVMSLRNAKSNANLLITS